MVSIINIGIEGPVISSYPVSDRTQVADVDPSMLIEEYEEEDQEDQPCPICGLDDNEDRLLQCDGCDGYYHTYCIGLDDVPVGHFFCEECETQRAIEASCPTTSNHRITHHTRASRPHRSVDRRTRGQQRRISTRNQISSSNWARVWQSVWDNLNLDLDFPFDDGADVARIDRSQRASSERGGLRQWERRLQVAERQGGGERFRNALHDIHAAREQPEAPPPESREEIRAWNALEKAKEIELDPTPKRKRKSATTSPSEPEPIPQIERPLKRPRTRRALDCTDVSASAVAESSGSRRSSAAGPSSSRTPLATNSVPQGNSPSFLQSMLKEIESSSAPDEKSSSRYSLQIANNHSSTQPSSPGVSPTSSNHGTPRARSITPPPSLSPRPASPLGLTSMVEPIYPPPEFSPERSPADPALAHRPFQYSRDNIKGRRQSRPLQQVSSPPSSKDASPTRTNMPLSLKSDLQRMVTTALRPHYHNNAVSKDQYTDINRNVSRMLYDKVADTGRIDHNARQDWEKLASSEVAKAIQSLKAVT